MPPLEFQFDSSHFQLNDTAPGKSSEFDLLFQNQWNKAVNNGVCRYKLTELKTKILEGKYQLVAQLNAERAQLRRRPQDLQMVDAAFDSTQFNFNQVPEREMLLSFRPTSNEASEKDGSVLIINISPLEFGNSLLVPNVQHCIAQRVTLPGLSLLIQVMLLSSDWDLRSGFNSPGGYASVNHQHFHLYYLRQRLYLETVSVEHLAGPCFALKDFPSKGFAFQLEGNDVPLLAGNVCRLVSWLRQQSIAHNLFVTRGKSFDGQGRDTLRVFVWARESTFGVKEEIGFNAALCELAGHLLIKEAPTFETVDEEIVVKELDSLTSPHFQRIRPSVSDLFSAESSLELP